MRIVQYLIRHEIPFRVVYINVGFVIRWTLNDDEIAIYNNGDIAYSFIMEGGYIYNKLNDAAAIEYIEAIVKQTELRARAKLC